jgi:hypothetical protein
MANGAAKTVTQVPSVNSVANTDALLVVFNMSNSAIAQAATISVSNFKTQQLISDPANSSSLTCNVGTILFQLTLFVFAMLQTT